MRVVAAPPADVVLFTPTRDRGRAFSYCERWMARQTFSGTALWVVVDDGDEPVTPSLGQLHLRRAPSAKKATLADNVLAAIPIMDRVGKAIVIEDDDWYAPTYVEEIVRRLNAGAQIVGTTRSRYYHLPTMMYKEHTNWFHSSFCSTAVSGEGIHHMQAAARKLQPREGIFVDMELWHKHRILRRDLFAGNHLVCGLKGWPGRKNLCALSVRLPVFMLDRDGKVFTMWVGREDAVSLLTEFGHPTDPIKAPPEEPSTTTTYPPPPQPPPPQPPPPQPPPPQPPPPQPPPRRRVCAS